MWYPELFSNSPMTPIFPLRGVILGLCIIVYKYIPWNILSIDKIFDKFWYVRKFMVDKIYCTINGIAYDNKVLDDVIVDLKFALKLKLLYSLQLYRLFII